MLMASQYKHCKRTSGFWHAERKSRETNGQTFHWKKTSPQFAPFLKGLFGYNISSTNEVELVCSTKLVRSSAGCAAFIICAQAS